MKRFGNKKKIVILGKLETKYNAPFDDSSWEIWSMNKHDDADLIPRVDVWFDIHEKPINKKANVLKKDFPFDKCNALMGGMYFNNITSYLIALACTLNAEELALYGMRFVTDHAHRSLELENVRQWLFFAKGRGIKVTIPCDKEFLLPEFKVETGKEYDQ